MHTNMFAGVAGVLLVGSASFGAFVPGSDFNITVKSNGNVEWMAMNDPGSITVEPLTSETFRVYGSPSNGTWNFDFDFEFSTNPGVAGSFTVTNMMAVTTNFTVELDVFSTEAIASPIMVGSTSPTVGDAVSGPSPGDGATLTAPGGGQLYDGQLNDASIRTLFEDPYTLVAPTFGTNSDTRSFGPEAAPALSIGDKISIEHTFDLSPNQDRATFNSTFFLIPTPGAGALLALAGLGAIRRRR